jgi:hypothetical protein
MYQTDSISKKQELILFIRDLVFSVLDLFKLCFPTCVKSGMNFACNQIISTSRCNVFELVGVEICETDCICTRITFIDSENFWCH